MKEYIIKENDADQRVDKFISKVMPTMPKSFMYKAIRNKKIKVNRKRCEISQRLQVNDVVLCFVPPQYYEEVKDYDFLHVPSNLEVVYEDDDCLILNKESGLLAHKDIKGIQDNVQDRLLHYLYDNKQYDPSIDQSFTPAIAHRLDRNTSGLMIASKKASFARMISEKIKNHEVKKYYLCIVEGQVKESNKMLKLYHKKDKALNKAMIFDHEVEGSQPIKMNYRLIKQKKQYALVEVELISGKSHQIRSVMAYLGYPLYGDVKYGANKNNKDTYQSLCAYKIVFDFTNEFKLSKQEIVLENCEIMQQFAKIMA